MLTAETPAEPRADSGAGRRQGLAERWRVVALSALVASPVLVGMVVAQTWHWSPPSDYALIELATRDVGGADTPLVGPFSRFGWNHPGPLLYWLLAAPYRLFGSEPAGLFVGAAAINLAAIGASSAVWFRRGRWPLLLLGSLGTALLLRSFGGFFTVDPWNPSVTVLVFLAFALLVWSMALGAYRMAPAAVLAGSFLAQTHLGYVPLVVALGLTGLVGLGWRLRSRPGRPPAGERRRVATWLGLAVVVGVLCWSGPLLEQVTHEPGNLGQIADHFRSDSEPTAGGGRAVEVVARHLAPTGVWLTGVEPTDPFTGDVVGRSGLWALPTLLGFVAGVVVAVRRRDRPVVWLQVVATVALVTGAAAITRTTGETFPYLFNWMRVVSMLLVVSALWAFYRALTPAVRARLDRPAAAVVVGAIALLSLMTSVSAIRTDLPYQSFSEAIDDLTGPTVSAVGDTPVLVQSIGACWDEVPMGLVLEIEKHGGTAVVPPELEHRFGEHRVFDGQNAEQVLTVGCRDAASFEPPEGVGELVAYHGELTPEEDERYQELAEEIRVELRAAGREDLLDAVPTVWITVLPDTGVDPELLAAYDPLVVAVQDRAAVYLGPLPSATADE